jgi:hypothetical protein
LCTLLLLIHRLDNHIMIPGRRQAVPAFFTNYMGFTWSGFQNYGTTQKIIKLEVCDEF